MSAHLASIPPTVIAVIAVLGVVELALDVVAFVDLYRRPVEQVVGGNKWLWVAIIVLVNFVGAILYLAIGHRPAPAVEPRAAADRPAETVTRIVDELYGARDDAPPS